MKVLLLSPYPQGLMSAFQAAGDKVVFPHDFSPVEDLEADYVVSYGYPHILRGPFLERHKHRMCNLHIGCLPWNRGAHPNFWSWFDGTPKGVTIHEIDEGLDTGPIIAQAVMHMSAEHETLESSYGHLHSMLVDLFQRRWPEIREKKYTLTLQRGKGSAHKKRDLEPIWPMLPKGWGTKCRDVEFLGERLRSNDLAFP